MKATDNFAARQIRRKLVMKHSPLWSKIGVTHSGRARDEGGRELPCPVQTLLRLVHVEQIDITKLRREDVEVAEYLRSNEPERFKELKKEARAYRKAGR